MEEMELTKCKECGRELEVKTNFKKTRWGTYSMVCNRCVNDKAMLKRMEQEELAKKAQEAEAAEKMKAQSELGKYTARDLIEELARRGYTGKLTYTVQHTIDITNF